jgi:hypothetical protein
MSDLSKALEVMFDLNKQIERERERADRAERHVAELITRGEGPLREALDRLLNVAKCADRDVGLGTMPIAALEQLIQQSAKEPQ